MHKRLKVLPENHVKVTPLTGIELGSPDPMSNPLPTAPLPLPRCLIYQLTFHDRSTTLERFFYLALDICPISFTYIRDRDGIVEIGIRGFFVVFVIIFFKADGFIPSLKQSGIAL